MSFRYIAGILGKAPVVVGPVDGEGGSAPGIWTKPDQANLQAQGLWPKPVLDKYLWGWGSNDSGQVGVGNTTNYSSPKQVGTLVTWATLGCGTGHTLATKSDGTLWAWGQNNVGQLGVGNTTNYSSPKQVGVLTNWLKVVGGQYYTIATKTNGTLWAWGQGNIGQLGLGNTTTYSSPKQVGVLTTWRNITTGRLHTLATKTDGTLWSWGDNSTGQLGLNSATYSFSSPVQVGSLTTWLNIAGGRYHTIATKTDGTLWSWGGGSLGQLGLSNTTSYSSPKQVGTLTTWAIVGRMNTSSISIKTDGTLWSWGHNNVGQLGLGNTTYLFNSPKQVGTLTTWKNTSGSLSNFISVVTTNGTLWAWGINTAGQLGLGNTTNYSSPKQVGTLTKWLSVAGGYGQTVALKTS